MTFADRAGRFATAVRAASLLALVSSLFLLVAPSASVEEAKPETPLSLAQRVAAVAADPRLFQATPETIGEQLRSVVRLEAGPATRHLWQFTGGTGTKGVVWAQAEFQSNEPGSGQAWELLQVRFALAVPPESPAGLYKLVRAELVQRLGKPARERSESAEKRVSWNPARYHEISVREGVFEDVLGARRDHLVVVGVAVLQGDR